MRDPTNHELLEMSQSLAGAMLSLSSALMKTSQGTPLDEEEMSGYFKEMREYLTAVKGLSADGGN